MTNSQKLQGKDLINIGIYAAIYCVITTAVAMLGFIPIMLPMLAIICPLVGGIPLMLFMTKVKKFGMVTILGILLGIYLWVTGMGYWPTIFAVIFGSLADLIAKSGDYKDSKKLILSSGIFHVILFANMIPLYLNIDGYFSTRQSFGEEYITSVTNIMQPWTAPVLFIGSFVAGVIGAVIGKKILKKHFEKAGIV